MDQYSDRLSTAARLGAAFIAFVAAVTLATRLYLRLGQSDGLLDALSYMSQYFTILTNTLTLVMMTWIALGRDVAPRFDQDNLYRNRSGRDRLSYTAGASCVAQRA